jgi:Ni,Fe-hydrogenase maturation factor
LNDVVRDSDAPGDAAGGVLVIGYGNTLRSDDGVGWHAAALLAGDRRLAGAEILAVHQLTPELALDFSRASLVILIDASADDPPGTISVRPLDVAFDESGGPGGDDAPVGGRGGSSAAARRAPGGRGAAGATGAGSGAGARRSGGVTARATGGGSGASSHHVGPPELLALAGALYGAAPQAFVVRVGVTEMEVGETLSQAVAAALPAIADVVVDLVRHRGLSPGSR